MQSAADICNIGSAILGDGFVTNGFQTSPITARDHLCARHYDRIRLELLRGYIWNFAKRRIKLPKAAVIPDFGYDNAYFLPAGFLRLIKIGERPVWESRSGLIYSIEQHPLEVNNPISPTARAILISLDEDELPITYIADLKNTTQFDAHFAKALGCQIFEEIGPGLTEEKVRIDRCSLAKQEALSEAYRTDSMETPEIRQYPDDWELARF